MELLPLFPLNIVVFPGEILNLHIFEPRYIELINDVLMDDLDFGMPTYINNSVEYGTTIKITEVTKIYEDGRMDLKSVGSTIFKVLKFYNPTYGKQYAAGKVEYIENINNPDYELRDQLREMLSELFNKLDAKKSPKISDEFNSYDVAHFAGLSVSSKYQLLKLTSEKERQKYLLKHLKKIMPVMENVEETKQRIGMNGHFRYFNPLDF